MSFIFYFVSEEKSIIDKRGELLPYSVRFNCRKYLILYLGKLTAVYLTFIFEWIELDFTSCTKNVVLCENIETQVICLQTEL